ncbi:unnamed protein product [Durusdinium trenchii]|uniref:26S protease regulatory subunit 8-like A n=2 Tax=Durusdinium trenchii TaxID=1381693 RepID=A0ABP0IEW7_9DINO
MQKARDDLQAARDEKIADAHREFEEGMEKAETRIQQEVAKAMEDEEARLKEQSAASVAKAKEEIFKEAIPAAQREAKESAQKRWRNKQVQHNFDGKDIDQDTRLSCMAGVVYIYIV